MKIALIILFAGAVSGVVLAAAESFCELERREYLRPTTSPMERPGEAVDFRAGDFGKPPSRAVAEIEVVEKDVLLRILDCEKRLACVV